jgi:hypothetical protein
MTSDGLAEQLSAALNSHGHGFHYRIIKEADDLFCQNVGPAAQKWGFEVAEFPLEAGGKNTRVDLILQSRETPVYLVVECKRANPAYSNWCFARAPYVRRNHDGGEFVAERIRFENDRLVSGGAVTRLLGGKGYDIALQLKAENPGDKHGKGHDVIEEAVTQVLLAANGLVDAFHREPQLIAKHRQAVVVPIIVTTANIWTTEKNLSETDIGDGTITGTPLAVQEAKWVQYRYPQSPTLRHTVERPAQTSFDSLSSWLLGEHIRSIVVVQGLAFKELLGHLDPDLYGIRNL